MRVIIILFLLGIFASLGSALFYMVRGPQDSRRMARALAIRVGLSITLFVMLMLGFYFGLIPGR